MKLTGPVKVVIGIALVVFLYFGLNYFGLDPSKKVKQAEVPNAFSLPSDAASVPDAQVTQVPLPSATKAAVTGPMIRTNIWAWNAQMAYILANGGPDTTKGSLMEQHHVNLKLIRQDDTDVSKKEELKFAQLLAKGQTEPSEGIHFVIIMGDQAAQHIASLNKELDRLGTDYRAEVIGAVGYSRGEDALMGPEEWKTNPESMKGGLIAGAVREGDWNIAQYFMAQNNIKNNPDERTIDRDAVNWVNVDYMKAAQEYVSNYCEDRAEVSGGKRTGKTVHACVQGTVTWTPSDVTIAKGRGGLIKVLSTKENPYQMPAVLIGIHKWDAAHKELIEDMLAASFEAADQVKHFEPALQRAGQASQAIYKEETPGYWVKYYRGVVEKDKAGISVPLGGSTVMNLADNLVLFGLANGSGGVDSSLFNATYTGFGNIVKQQYPLLVPTFPPTSEAVDTTYVSDLSMRMNVGVADTETFDATNAPISADNTVAKRNWSVEFDTGSAHIKPAGEKTLTDLYNQLIVGAAMSVELQGHTDDVGLSASNMVLSQQRADAVKHWLEQKSSTLFPANRISTQAYGDTKPLVPNTSAENRAKNRRVTVVLGTR